MAIIEGPQKLGPLTPLVGEWEGNVGVDVSYRHQDEEITNTGYFEKAWFKPYGPNDNGEQHLWGVTYGMTAWRHGEEDMLPFHDEVGYLIWDVAAGTVMRAVVFGRGIAFLTGSEAGPRDKTIHFRARPGDVNYGILQNPYLSKNAELMSFDGSFTFEDAETFSYTQDLVLRMEALGGKEMHHTDANTLHRVKRYHPSVQYN